MPSILTIKPLVQKLLSKTNKVEKVITLLVTQALRLTANQTCQIAKLCDVSNRLTESEVKISDSFNCA